MVPLCSPVWSWSLTPALSPGKVTGGVGRSEYSSCWRHLPVTVLPHKACPGSSPSAALGNRLPHVACWGPMGATRATRTEDQSVQGEQAGCQGVSRGGLALSLIGQQALLKVSICLVLPRPNTDLSFFTSICCPCRLPPSCFRLPLRLISHN